MTKNPHPSYLQPKHPITADLQQAKKIASRSIDQRRVPNMTIDQLLINQYIKWPASLLFNGKNW